jgi:hypothetical protein
MRKQVRIHPEIREIRENPFPGGAAGVFPRATAT